VPTDPKAKLAWLRKYRPGAVQTPEQLVDGLQLATVILDVRSPPITSRRLHLIRSVLTAPKCRM